jgi:hypothetical protein
MNGTSLAPSQSVTIVDTFFEMCSLNLWWLVSKAVEGVSNAMSGRLVLNVIYLDGWGKIVQCTARSSVIWKHI